MKSKTIEVKKFLNLIKIWKFQPSFFFVYRKSRLLDAYTLYRLLKSAETYKVWVVNRLRAIQKQTNVEDRYKVNSKGPEHLGPKWWDPSAGTHHPGTQMKGPR